MKKTAKVQRYVWLKGFLLTMLLHTGLSGFTAIPGYQPSSCIIDDLQRNNLQNSVSYSWAAVSGATAYKVYFIRLSDGYTSSVYTTSSTSYNSPALTSGAYKFFFAPICGNETPSYIADEVIIN